MAMTRSSKKLGTRLPATIDPILLAGKRARLTGVVPLKDMRRLAGLCRVDTGEVEVDLQFDRTETAGIYSMEGSLTATVQATCQRCLERMALRLGARPRVYLVRQGELEDMAAREAEVLVIEKPLLLSELVEDELLLVMPMIPMHDPEDCPVGLPAAERRPVRGTRQQARASPFSVLSKLKQDKT